MYAIVEINGQQFKAEAGKRLFVHHIADAEANANNEAADEAAAAAPSDEAGV